MGVIFINISKFGYFKKFLSMCVVKFDCVKKLELVKNTSLLLEIAQTISEKKSSTGWVGGWMDGWMEAKAVLRICPFKEEVIQVEDKG